MSRLRLDSNMFLPSKFQFPLQCPSPYLANSGIKSIKKSFVYSMKKHIWSEKAAIIGAKISRSIPTTPCSVLVWVLWGTERGRLKDWSVPHYCRHLQSRHSGTPSPRTWSPSSSTSPTSWSSYLMGACAGETITVLQTLRVGEPTTAPYCSCLVSN